MKGDTEHAVASGVGALLRASRQRLGEDISTISRTLRIRQRYLQAIEDSAFDDLPGPTYAVGFVRAYAEHVGLDCEEVVRRFKAETSALNGAAELRFPSPMPESGVPGGTVLVIGLLLAGLAYGVWYAMSDDNGFLAELISPLPERFGALIAEDDAPDAASDAKAPGQPVAPPTSEKDSEPVAHTAETGAVTEPESGTPEATSGPSPDEGTYPPPPQPGEPEPDLERDAVVVDADDRATAESTVRAAVVVDAATGDQAARGDEESSDSGAVVEARDPTEESSDDVADSDLPSEPESPTGESAATAADAVALPSTMAPDPSESAESATVAAADDVAPVPYTEETVSAAPQLAVQPVLSSIADDPAASNTDRSEVGDEVASVPDASATPSPDGGAGAETGATEQSGRVFGDLGDTRIVVRARLDSWIQVRDDVANRLLVTRLLRAGDVYRVPDREGLKLSTGDAGALEILVDGQAVPPIGGKGDVRRGVALDAEQLCRGSAVTQ